MAVQFIKTITEFHELRGLPKPKHPLISLINFADVKYSSPQQHDIQLSFSFYTISVKKGMDHKYKYGEQEYEFDFNNGTVFFMAPNQVLKVKAPVNGVRPSGWMLMIHPDFIWNTSLATTIHQNDFFEYSVNEALFLSEDEEQNMILLLQNIKKEYEAAIDQFSQNIIISQIETLLNYSQRYYQRQFITRKKVNHTILSQIDQLLNQRIHSAELAEKGSITVQFLCDELHISPSYLRSLLKNLIGKTPQEYIHSKLIEKAKEKLSTTTLSVGEIAYELGFEFPQSFSKLFKKYTKQTPMEFRAGFN
ncbi:helix-turn-helix domain-containing protein [Flavobacterium hercynium]|uniref:AraC family transcriptional regulator n=1 Tax=Flavobacterium hercynium TaxID=387094 RepID=A0A226H773_9FLAO|nr:response regulator transcription factor [Flavobacterium hercynium]OXA90062.1 AraC family transcriptional regulator [Flavobacterium hercynium]SMP14708.1 transcriptional regulator, AraC family [Flavobacterium hercynium]